MPLSIVLLMRQEGYGYGEIGAVVGGRGPGGRPDGGVRRAGSWIGSAGARVILATGASRPCASRAETVAILSARRVAAARGARRRCTAATIPPISASMRSLWASLVPRSTLESAYAFDAIQLELVFVVGPLIAAGLATAITPAVGMFLCAGFYLIAALGFATAPAVRAAPPDEQVERTRAGALGPPACARSSLVGAVTAISFGALEVALPAFAEQEGSRAAVGPLHHAVVARVFDRRALVRRRARGARPPAASLCGPEWHCSAWARRRSRSHRRSRRWARCSS